MNDVATGLAGAQGFSPYAIGDSGADYLHDANGNVKSDPSKALGMTYNYLNLPETISENDGNGEVTWLYDAAGMKLRKSANTVSSTLHLSGSITSDTYQAEEITSNGTVLTGSQVIFEAGTEIKLQAGFETQLNSDFEAKVTGVTGGEVRDYVNGIEYRNGVIEAIYHANGRVYFDNGIPRYEYTITDHLGNARLSFADLNENGTIEVTTDPATNELLQENHYYPFGMGMEGPWKGHPDRMNPYQYNGKELNQDLGLNWLDYGARWYDPSIGRWNAVDPLAEEYASISSYAYVANTPINAIDPDGKRIFFVGGAGNDADGWNYIGRWGRFLTQGGISGFHRVNASSGKWGDVAFTQFYRSLSYSYTDIPSSEKYDEWERITHRRQSESIFSAVHQIEENLSDNPLGDGEQLNLAGYSYGSVLQAHVALRLADEGNFVDNLILIGSPISDDSELYNALTNHKNIGNVLRVDIEGDLLSNPQSVSEWIKGAVQNGGDDGPHFNLARPGDETDRAIQVVIEWLRQQGVE